MGNSIRRGVGHFRWVICTLLLFGVTKNYMDRQVLGVLKTTLQHDLGWNEIDYSNLVFVFQGTYAVGMVVVGRLVDRLGTRLGYALAMVFWSLASMAHAVGSSLMSFMVARSALGFGEAGVFPASIKTVAEWFPSKTTLAGIFNAGTNIGTILTPLMFHGLRSTGDGESLSSLPAPLVLSGWYFGFYSIARQSRTHARRKPGGIRTSDRRKRRHKSRVKLLLRQTWAFAVSKFTIDPIWWFLLFWILTFCSGITDSS
jgi:ACS family hexuronate transporter-like MFS transporter